MDSNIKIIRFKTFGIMPKFQRFDQFLILFFVFLSILIAIFFW